ncbi:MAG: DUF3108 domain-containing protein [Desulfobulbaceae bacterium]|uniref:DUF3108 domain-containing protein n=1 Tax=Candidatus Desulfatifera sulfidica TaxID=2841691 RepID=A0A8J6TDT0_9BACT|nr:DUF3108 domain-containing protein [Candidatus Desulfatifera sulfidica]
MISLLIRLVVLGSLGQLLAGTVTLAESLEAQPRVNEVSALAIDCRPEVLTYDISWTGGIKIGKMNLAVVRNDKDETCEIHARVRDSGLFRLFYPVDDTFVTQVDETWLPLRYEVEQREGEGYEARRLTVYDQRQGLIRYWKNKGEEQEFTAAGPVHNEFTSFFVTRFLPWSTEHTRFVVPTWADESRNPVEVELRGTKRIYSHYMGTVETLEVLPRMTFKGLYDKSGDTVIWFSDDRCRIPLRINSKILIGSLTAELKEYDGERCPEWLERIAQRRSALAPELDWSGMGD